MIVGEGVDVGVGVNVGVGVIVGVWDAVIVGVLVAVGVGTGVLTPKYVQVVEIRTNNTPTITATTLWLFATDIDHPPILILFTTPSITRRNPPMRRSVTTGVSFKNFRISSMTSHL